MPTYNHFRDVLFWDIIQALTKLYMIKRNLKKKAIRAKILKGDNPLESSSDEEDSGEDDDLSGDDSLLDEDATDIIHHPKVQHAKVKMRLELEFENIDGEK